MADNAPNSVQRPPFPNVVAQINRRLEQHIINFTGANGSVTFNADQSSPGTGCTRTGEGLYTLVFPAGGTGCLGWTEFSCVESTTSDVTIARGFSVDTDVVANNYAAGSIGLVSVDYAATPAVNDVIGEVTIVVNIIKAPS